MVFIIDIGKRIGGLTNPCPGVGLSKAIFTIFYVKLFKKVLFNETLRKIEVSKCPPSKLPGKWTILLFANFFMFC